MKEIPVVYNKFWTVDCVSRIKNQCSLATEIENILINLEKTVDYQYNAEIKRLSSEVRDLERSLYKTYSAMEQYMYDMEYSIGRIEKLIDEAKQHNAKVLE